MLLCSFTKIILYFILLFNITYIHSQSIDIDGIASILHNIETSYSLAFHHSNITNVNTAPYDITMQQFVSVELQNSLSTSNLFKLLTSTQTLGGLLSEEIIVPNILLGIRMKPHTFPINMGIYVMEFNIQTADKTIRTNLTNFASYVQYILLQQSDVWNPTVSIGLVYAYSQLALQYKLTQIEFDGIDTSESETRIKIEAPIFDLHIHTHSIASRLQISRRWAWIEPFMGIEPSLYVSIVSTNTDSKIFISKDQGNTFSRHSSFNEVAENFLKKKNLIYNQVSVIPTMRLYGGVSLNVKLFYFDFQLAIDPLTSLLTTNLGIRILWE